MIEIDYRAKHANVQLDDSNDVADNSLLVNVPRRIVAWEFEISTELSTSVAGTHWVLLRDRLRGSRVVSPLQLPPPAAVAAFEAMDDTDMLAVKPGETVAIDVDIKEGLLAKEVATALKQAADQAATTLGATTR